MKLTRDEFERMGIDAPLELFIQGIKAEEARERWTLRQAALQDTWRDTEG